jgi:hypothetical protein
MDVLGFLKVRTEFVRRFYETAAEPFCETKRKIEAGQVPFKSHPLYDDPEPPFLEEWIEADTSIQILGRTCLSMLAGSLRLYLQEWQSELGIKVEAKNLGKIIRKKGLIHGYQEILGFALEECPASLALLEQVVLARNRDQHPDAIFTMLVHHTSEDLKKYKKPFFIDEREWVMHAQPDMAETVWMNPALSVSRETLFEAIREVETFAEWLEQRMLEAKLKAV